MAIPPRVAVKDKVLYMGIRISSSLASIARTNYSLVLNKVEEDTKRWKHLPAAIPGRVSVVKMNILPHIFISSMIPLAPPPGYWQNIRIIM